MGKIDIDQIQMSESEAFRIVKEDMDFINKKIGHEQMGQDFMIEAIKQARLHLDSTFEDKFKWGGAPKPTNYNDYRESRSFQAHAAKIWGTIVEYMLKGDLSTEKKDHLTSIHYTKGVKTVQFHYMLNGILVCLVRHGRYKGAYRHDHNVLDDSLAKNERAWRICYDKVKYGLQY